MRFTRALIVGAAAVLGLVGTVFAAQAGTQTSVIYNTVSTPLHGNMPSEALEAQSASEFGDQITFSSTPNRALTNVVLTMSSWGCLDGHWNSGDCSTPTGATFTEPITLNIYNPPAADSATPGSLITSITQTFAIPYRPSASAKCGDGRWFDNSLKNCFNGYATNITFNFPSGVTVPDSVVYGIAYNTTHFGYTPYGENTDCYQGIGSTGGCGYDSLNIGLAMSTPTSGTDATPGQTFVNSSWSGAYCDGGTAGTGIFRLDSPTSACWGSYTPAIQFKAAGGNSKK